MTTAIARWTMILTRLELHYCANISAECMHGLKRLHHLGFTLIGEGPNRAAWQRLATRRVEAQLAAMLPHLNALVVSVQ